MLFEKWKNCFSGSPSHGTPKLSSPNERPQKIDLFWPINLFTIPFQSSQTLQTLFSHQTLISNQSVSSSFTKITIPISKTIEWAWNSIIKSFHHSLIIHQSMGDNVNFSKIELRLHENLRIKRFWPKIQNQHPLVVWKRYQTFLTHSNTYLTGVLKTQ